MKDDPNRLYALELRIDQWKLIAMFLLRVDYHLRASPAPTGLQTTAGFYTAQQIGEVISKIDTITPTSDLVWK